jgi:hypothetical protein
MYTYICVGLFDGAFWHLLREKLGVVINIMEKQNYLNQNNMNLKESITDISQDELFDFIRKNELERLSMRVSYGRKNAVKQGRVMLSIAPYGYRFEKGTLIVKTEEGNVVRMIFVLLNGGKTVNEVSEALNEQGVLTRRGKDWTSAKIRHIVKSEVYMGNLYFNKTQTIFENGNRKTIKNPRDKWIKINVIPIVSIDLFNSVQDRFKLKPKLEISYDQMNDKVGFVESNQSTALYIRTNGLDHERTS